MKIAILGGSFDPIHLGHIAMANYVLKKKDIDEVWFMVANQNPQKEKSTSFFHRYCMVKEALKPYKKMKACDFESNWPAPSYSIQTIEYLTKKFPNYEWVWLIGADQADRLHTWKNIETLSTLVDFYVFPRDNFSKSENLVNLVYMDFHPINVSSTSIRQGHKRYLLPKSTKVYISKHYLYMEEVIQTFMSEKRLLHSKRVAELCKELAFAHNLNTDMAFIAGLMHDICKEFSKQKLMPYMKYLFDRHIEEAPAIWHGYVGSYVCKKYGIYNQKICHAIYHHVLGNGNSQYDKILYLSDKLEMGRGYDTSFEIAIARKNLSKAIKIVKQQQQEYLQKNRND